LVISGASGSRVVLQHASAVAHGTRADDLVAGPTAQRLWAFEETSEDCGSEPFGTWICTVSSFCADSSNGKKV
jgi:hypothetical protein